MATYASVLYPDKIFNPALSGGYKLLGEESISFSLFYTQYMTLFVPADEREIERITTGPESSAMEYLWSTNRPLLMITRNDFQMTGAVKSKSLKQSAKTVNSIPDLENVLLCNNRDQEEGRWLNSTSFLFS